jgi:hypothetical protein
MTQITQGSLTMIGLNTKTPSVFWNGHLVPFITGIRVEWEDDEQRVKLKVSEIEQSLLTELVAAGLAVFIPNKKGHSHE